VTLIGHHEAQLWLRRALVSNRLAHAYLLTGPRSVGKRTFALEIAQALNCVAPRIEDRPDHSCQQCRLLQRNVHPDLRVVRRAPERTRLWLNPADPPLPQRDYTDYVKFIQADAQLKPAMGRTKIYLIIHAEDLSDDAGARLLKTIEEPPAHVLFLLTAIERGAVMPTVASRCQEIRLHPATRAELSEALIALGTEPARASQLAALAGGRQGWALEAARDNALYEQQQAYAQQLVGVVAGSRLDRLLRARALTDHWTTHKEQVRETLRTWLSWWRDVTLIQLGLTDRIAHLEPAERAILESAAAQIDLAAARAASAAIQQTLEDLDTNVNARLAIDLMVLRLPRARLA
jgi:DNA polymerase-3 subunit delta'